MFLRLEMDMVNIVEMLPRETNEIPVFSGITSKMITIRARAQGTGANCGGRSVNVVEEYQPELSSLIASWWTPNIHIIHEGSC